MKRKFGFWSIVLLTINSIVGSGIFLSPGSVLEIAGTYTPLVYIVAAIFAGILAMTFASAAKYVSRNGASYAYAEAGYGDTIGYYIGITRYFAMAVAWGVQATAVVRLILVLFMGADGATYGRLTLGFFLFMAALFGVNLWGTGVIKWVNNFSTIGKLLALVTAIVAGIWVFQQTGINHFAEINQLTAPDGSRLVPPMTSTLFVSGVVTTFYALAGFENVATASEEMEEPARNLPRALPVAFLIIIAIYVSLVTVIMLVNPEGVLLSHSPVALADAFSNPLVHHIIVYGALISMIGINIALSFNVPRILDAIVAEHQLPQVLARKNRYGVSVLNYSITVLLAVLIPLAFNYQMTEIMVVSSISRFLQFIVVPLAVVRFYYGREKQPVLQEVQHNWLTDVLVPLVGLVITIFLLIKFDWIDQFTRVENGQRQLNLLAVGAMVMGFVVMPALLYWWNKKA
ncbi:APC family permease [Enterococcus sp. AZ109]|uniref:APC family permease n=1 Tax=Enterococcus sp. AZ109 TaxID=2774634 RepID=UPI003F1ECA66